MDGARRRNPGLAADTARSVAVRRPAGSRVWPLIGPPAAPRPGHKVRSRRWKVFRRAHDHTSQHVAIAGLLRQLQVLPGGSLSSLIRQARAPGRLRLSSTAASRLRRAPPTMGDDQRRLWCEEDIEEGLRWSYAVKEVLHTGKSEFQTVELFDTLPWGKTLLLDGKLQSADADEKLYHECTLAARLPRMGLLSSTQG